MGWVTSILRQPAGVLEAQGFSATRGFSLGWFGAEHKSWYFKAASRSCHARKVGCRVCGVGATV